MGSAALLYRLILRPMLRERGRSMLILLSVALGVAVVLAIDLASGAATGSFRSSMETLSGDNDLEVTATGGVPENLIGKLNTLPYRIRVSARVEDHAAVGDAGETVPLIGVDLIAEVNQHADERVEKEWDEGSLQHINDLDAVWVTRGLGRKVGEPVALLINDTSKKYVVRGLIPDTAQLGTDAVVMDIGAAQAATGKAGRVDRILIKLPEHGDLEPWERTLREVVPAGIQLQPQGSQTAANRKMLSAFRWNLRVLSYIAVLVGAFLIYNTISVSVVRRRAQIGTVRALGASRKAVLAAFLIEAAIFGLVGSALAIPLGRLMASGAVRLLSTTVDALYISSRPGAMTLSVASLALAFLVGIGVTLASALSPALEASRVPPTEAMARGAREYAVRVERKRDVVAAIALAALAAAAAQAPAIAGKPLFGYLAAVLLIASCALAVPTLVHGVMATTSGLLRRVAGVEALLASRSLAGSLRRTSVLVCALATAIAMMTSVAIMVGSFRQTVISWMDTQLPADLYLRPAGNPSADRHPTIAPEFAQQLATLPGVAYVSRFRAYEIEYEGLPMTVASVETTIPRFDQTSGFVSGRPPAAVLKELAEPGTAMVSEPFANKHHVKAGDVITLPLGLQMARLRIVDIFYDYANERGYVILSRQNMLSYLHDPAASNLAVYLKPGADLKAVRSEIERAAGHRDVLIFSNGELRHEAIRIFDQTFAITYALEAISVMVAVMGIAGALLSIVFDRRREFGLLHYLGAATGQIRKLILIEAGLIGILSNIAGLVLGIALSLVLIFVINKQSFGWTIRFHWPVEVLLGALSIVYAATVMAGLYPARFAQKLNPIEVIHED
ncbi:MAG: ABC transporter permease [Janthinobacterium lividum]